MRTHGARLPVLRDPVERERDAEDGRRRGRRKHDGGKALDALLGEHDPRDRGEACEHDREARVREEHGEPGEVQEERAERVPAHGEPERDRHADGGEERELVPVVERGAQPCETAVVRIDRRHALRDERPHEQRGEERGGAVGEPLERTRERRGGEHAEECEGGVDERPVRVLPRAVRRHRPDRRQPDPGGEREERAEEGRRRAVEPRRGDEAGERRGAEERGEGDGEPADPDERPEGRPLRQEECRECEGAGGPGDDGPGGGPAFAQSSHRR